MGDREPRLTGFDPERFDWSEVPYLRQAGRYVFFGLCAAGMGTLAAVSAIAIGMSRDWANNIAGLTMLVSFLALRDMSAQWNWVLHRHSKDYKERGEAPPPPLLGDWQQ